MPGSKRAKGPEGAIRVRTVIELTVLFAVAFSVFQVAPIVALRMEFLDKLAVIAHSPVQDSAAVLRRKVLDTAAGLGIVLNSEDLHVRRDRQAGRTIIDVSYQLHIVFFPRYTYVWNVHDHVEALLL